ncbi:MAG: hypothetical protein ABEJ28_12700 [Salinigranum sp.]
MGNKDDGPSELEETALGRQPLDDPVLECSLDEDAEVGTTLLEGARALGVNLDTRSTLLYDVIDPDALGRAFRRRGRSWFVFELWGFLVVVTAESVKFFDLAL